jgi:hypothetical protein
MGGVVSAVLLRHRCGSKSALAAAVGVGHDLDNEYAGRVDAQGRTNAGKQGLNDLWREGR